MQKQIRSILGKTVLGLSLLTSASYSLAAIEVKDSVGTLTLEQAAERVVVLEFSFADALVNLKVTPVGIADDNQPNRILPQILAQMPNYVSVGTRAQPSLEKIAELKPDLIVADINRHRGIYEQLKQIAPTLILNSQYEDYQTDLDNAYKISQATGEEATYANVLAAHKEKISALAKKVDAQNRLAAFLTSRETKLGVYTETSYLGSILKHIGFQTIANQPNGNGRSYDLSIEQLVALQPQVLFVANYVPNSITQGWIDQKNPLWFTIPAVKNSNTYNVDVNVWARARGITASEVIVQQIVDFMGKKD